MLKKTDETSSQNSSTGVESRWSGFGGGGSSGCTCERPQGQSSKTVHTENDSCEKHGGRQGGEGGQQIVSLSTSRGMGRVGGGLLIGLTKGFSIVIKDGGEGEVKGRQDFRLLLLLLFFPLWSRFLDIPTPRVGGRGCGDGPQRLAGEELLLPWKKKKQHRTCPMSVCVWVALLHPHSFSL